MKDDNKNLKKKIIVESIKLIVLLILLGISIYYVIWLNNAGNFPEL